VLDPALLLDPLELDAPNDPEPLPLAEPEKVESVELLLDGFVLLLVLDGDELLELP